MDSGKLSFRSCLILATASRPEGVALLIFEKGIHSQKLSSQQFI